MICKQGQSLKVKESEGVQIFLRIEDKVYNCYYREDVVNVLSTKLNFLSYDEFGDINLFYFMAFPSRGQQTGNDEIQKRSGKRRRANTMLSILPNPFNLSNFIK